MRFQDLLAQLDQAAPCVWVAVAHVQGSAPRDADASMLVTPTAVSGTIGGGHLELKAIALAREWLRLGKTTATRRHYPLGPALGQCCGGAVDVLFRPVTSPERAWVEVLAQSERSGGEVVLETHLDVAAPHTVLVPVDRRAAMAPGVGASTRVAELGGTTSAPDIVVTRHLLAPWHVWIFGAGHVGAALVQVLGTLPCELTWVDSRETQFPASVGHNVQMRSADQPADEVDDIPSGADVLVLTHSHALDLDIVTRLLRRDDLGYLGMIGSATKASLFRRRLAERGVDATRLVCPIGTAVGAAGAGPRAGDSGKHPRDKHPGVIAVSVAAQLLAHRAAGRHLPLQQSAHV